MTVKFPRIANIFIPTVFISYVDWREFLGPAKDKVILTIPIFLILAILPIVPTGHGSSYLIWPYFLGWEYLPSIAIYLLINPISYLFFMIAYLISCSLLQSVSSAQGFYREVRSYGVLNFLMPTRKKAVLALLLLFIMPAPDGNAMVFFCFIGCCGPYPPTVSPFGLIFLVLNIGTGVFSKNMSYYSYFLPAILLGYIVLYLLTYLMSCIMVKMEDRETISRTVSAALLVVVLYLPTISLLGISMYSVVDLLTPPCNFYLDPYTLDPYTLCETHCVSLSNRYSLSTVVPALKASPYCQSLSMPGSSEGDCGSYSSECRITTIDGTSITLIGGNGTDDTVNNVYYCNSQ
jgi:hypothetical protein